MLCNRCAEHVTIVNKMSETLLSVPSVRHVPAASRRSKQLRSARYALSFFLNVMRDVQLTIDRLDRGGPESDELARARMMYRWYHRASLRCMRITAGTPAFERRS